MYDPNLLKSMYYGYSSKIHAKYIFNSIRQDSVAPVCSVIAPPYPYLAIHLSDASKHKWR